MFDVVLTSAERALLEALNALGVRYLIVGMGAALLEGAPETTPSGLESFESEFARARDYDLDGVPVKVLPLERVIVSKRAAQRPKDAAQTAVLDAIVTRRG